MLDLTGRTKPGPFLPRTVELGGYLGIRRAGRLVAMAGERFRPPGYTEISAVCTDQEWRGHGFASRLTRAVAAAIVARGETPFLHAVATNVNAIRLYKSLGFSYRRDMLFIAAKSPQVTSAPTTPAALATPQIRWRAHAFEPLGFAPGLRLREPDVAALRLRAVATLLRLLPDPAEVAQETVLGRGIFGLWSRRSSAT